MSIMKIKQLNKSIPPSQGLMAVCGHYPVEESIIGLTFRLIIYSDGSCTYNQQCTCKRLAPIQLYLEFIL